MTNTPFSKSKISFYSGHHLLRGSMYIPAQPDARPWPGVVMAPGFSGTMDSGYEEIAARLCEEGLAVLLFDYPNFGESGTLIIREADPAEQVDAYRNAISFLASQHRVDAEKIGIWGGSYAGGHVLQVAALDKRVKAVVSLTPFVSGSAIRQLMPPQAIAFLEEQFISDRLNRCLGKLPQRIPVIAEEDNQFAIIQSPGARHFLQNIKHTAPTFTNEVTLKSLEMQLHYEPAASLKQTAGIEKLFILCESDDLMPAHTIRQAFDDAPEPKSWKQLPGNHFSPYMEEMENTAGVCGRWLKEKLS